MSPIEKISLKKREVAVVVPYLERINTRFFFLQERDDNAPILPGWFGLFGGGVEQGESPEVALKREIQEELSVSPALTFFNRYEFIHAVNHVFITEVAESFEADIHINEGKGGRFFSSAEVFSEPKIADSNKLILQQVDKTLRGEFTW